MSCIQVYIVLREHPPKFVKLEINSSTCNLPCSYYLYSALEGLTLASLVVNTQKTIVETGKQGIPNRFHQLYCFLCSYEIDCVVNRYWNANTDSIIPILKIETSDFAIRK